MLTPPPSHASRPFPLPNASHPSPFPSLPLPAPQLTESLTSVAWAYGSVVNATIDPVTNKLSVNFYGDGGKGAKAVTIKEGRTFTLGPKVRTAQRSRVWCFC